MKRGRPARGAALHLQNGRPEGPRSGKTRERNVMLLIKLKPLLLNLLIPLGVGGLAAFLTRGTMDVYSFLKLPPLSPPGWIFPVVWSVLYLLMGIAAYLVWMRDSTGRLGALLLYGLQLAFNFVWPLLFFSARRWGLSFFWLLGLWILVLLTTVRFFRETKAAGWLMVPYLLWVTFAVYLNGGVWYLN